MQLFNQAQGALKNRRFKEAETILQKIIARDARNFDALHLLGVVCFENGKVSEAEQFFLTALSIDSKFPPLFHNYGLFLAKQKRYQDSIEQFNKALRLYDNFAPVYADRGISLMELGRLDEALASHNKAVALAPNVPNVFYNRANTFLRQKQYDAALRDYNKAIELHPNYADAYIGRGNVFIDLKRNDEALAAYDRALALKPDAENAWLGRGNVFIELRRNDEAFAAYDRALALKPDLEGAWLGRGNLFFGLRRYDEAMAAYDKALAFKPDFAEAWLGRGNVFVDLKYYDEAFAAYDKALALKSDLAVAWLGCGNVFFALKRHDEAFAAYDRAFALKPDLQIAEGARLHSKMHLCDWSNLAAECEHLTSSIKNRKVNAEPFSLLGIPASPDDQLQCARLWAEVKSPPSRKPIWQGEQYRHDRIRVAYLSADFRRHATSFLMAGMFDCHDKSRFETTAISIGSDDNSEMRQRLKRSFDHFIDATILSDEEIASRIKETEIDILIDLKGFTGEARTNVLARRSAPIQVNYLGYPGTMGASYIDYLIADQTIIPNESRSFYSEKIAILPNTYQVNDRKRLISDKAFTRSDVGLPPQGFVFCCFNNNYKITPSAFDCWMRTLRKVESSVLWVLQDNPSAASNLKKEASARGVRSERLIFAKRLPLAEHLARHRLADLFLDTLPYNAHTTASDALWAGLPVLTCLGETFAGRVAASLLNAIRLPELITTTPEAYEQMAIDLAMHPEKLTAIKRKLSENRLTTPLFDTKLFTRHIEAAYIAMYERHQAGLAPDHISIPN